MRRSLGIGVELVGDLYPCIQVFLASFWYSMLSTVDSHSGQLWKMERLTGLGDDAGFQPVSLINSQATPPNSDHRKLEMRRFAFACLLFFTASECSAEVLYGVDNATDQLITIDASTGLGTAVGALGTARMAGIAVRSDGVIFGSADFEANLVTINPTTGFATVVGAFELPGIRGLAFNSGGVLYGIDDGTDSIVTINTSTGKATAISTVSLTNVSGLAFDTTDQLFATDSVSGDLLTINPLTGAHNVVGSFDQMGSSIRSLSFDSNGTLFGADVTTDQLFTINTLTGEATAVGEFEGGFGVVSGIAFGVAAIPEPSHIALIVFGLTGAVVQYRRRHRSE
ncbi:MAG: hypothetical protein NXI04_15925 [Planctomycetaceae bacterium]|nr:hypothetical protein [Planctomycetaceae bacterium]